MADGEIRPFHLDVPQADLDDLHQRLERMGAPAPGRDGLRHDPVQWSEFDRGGHFAAMEEPDLVVADVRRLFARLR